ncbi:cytochrome c oxidase subunit 1, partial [Microlunatus flavus]
ATSCPPPRHNFTSIPRIRSEAPAFDLHHPEVALSEYGDEESLKDTAVDAAQDDGRRNLLEARVEERSDDRVDDQEDVHPNVSPKAPPGQDERG